jgi:sugar-specific transcriptional regulator TrmB
MIVKQEIISKIRDYFDLNIYETKAWLALLSKGIASAGNIATLSGVPRSRTYDVLESLEKKGFAIVKMGKPVKYLGVKPRMVLEKLKNNVKKHAEDKIKDLSNIRDTSEFLKLQEIYDQGIEPVKKEDILSALKGRANISNYLKEILQEAKREVMICMNAEELMNKSKLFTETFDILKKRDIRIKLALTGDERLIKLLEDKLAVKIKRFNIESKFFIIDKQQVLFFLSKDTKKDDEIFYS